MSCFILYINTGIQTDDCFVMCPCSARRGCNINDSVAVTAACTMFVVGGKGYIFDEMYHMVRSSLQQMSELPVDVCVQVAAHMCVHHHLCVVQVILTQQYTIVCHDRLFAGIAEFS